LKKDPVRLNVYPDRNSASFITFIGPYPSKTFRNCEMSAEEPRINLFCFDDDSGSL
jgi:hypothetical protein